MRFDQDTGEWVGALGSKHEVRNHSRKAVEFIVHEYTEKILAVKLESLAGEIRRTLGEHAELDPVVDSMFAASHAVLDRAVRQRLRVPAT